MEQVHRPGLDGIVEVSGFGNQFVPDGKSAWEMGVNNDKVSKANSDFQTRTENTDVAIQRETTFIFVTPREWQNKDDWAQEKKDDSDWKDVIVLDCNDLEHWLELSPAVDIWFSLETGRRPAGIIDLAHRWTALSQIAEHPLSHDVILSSRDQTCADLLNWFDQEPSSLLLSSSSSEDSLDFLSAFVAQNAEDSAYLERMFVIDDVDAWRQLAHNQEPLIMVANSSLGISATDVSHAVTNGHHVLIVGRRMAGHSSGELSIPRQESFLLSNKLRECGFDDATASNMAKACCGSSTILKRLLTQHTDVAFPEWSQDANRAIVVPLALIGGWLHRVPAEPREEDPLPRRDPIDLECLNDFMGVSRDELEQLVNRWSDCDQPLLIRFHDTILIASREDAWFLLGSAITPQILERFEDLASFILDEDNPALDLEAEQRWLANIHGKTHLISNDLRKGILETLALMATYPTSGTPAMNVDFMASVRRVFDRVLPEGASWRRWATFGGSELKLFAEADPDFLLSRLQDDLLSEDPQIPQLFAEGNTGVFGGGSYHCGLLWALETIAWSPDYLPRVTKVLGRLMEIENRLPQNSGNRPSATLRKIFLWWLPHTNATIPVRINSLNQLCEEQPETGWQLLVNLLPSITGGFCDNSAQPRWRDWAVGWTRDNSRQNINQYADALADCVLAHAGNDSHRWSQILEGILRYNIRVTNASFETLEEIAANSTDEKGRTSLWSELDELIRRHERFPEADWSAPEEILERLRVIRTQLTPNDPVVLSQWLFEGHPELPDVDTTNGYDEYHAALDQRRLGALRQICEQQGFEGIQRLMQDGANGHSVGWILGRDSLLKVEQMGLAELIGSNDSNQLQLADSYLGGLFQSGGFDSIQPILGTLSTEQQSFVLVSCRQERATWDWIDENCSEEVQTAFWTRVNRVWHFDDLDELNHVVDKLLNVKRAYTAADIVYMASIRETPLDVDLAFRVLLAGLNAELNEESIERSRVHPIQHLIGFLQEANAGRDPDLLQIEWGYLSLLDRHSSQTRPITLFNAMTTDPSWYVELVKLVFRERGDDSERPELSPNQENMIRNAHDLLDTFARVPGTQDDGSIDENELRHWTDQVRQLATDANRIEVTDSNLGGLFAKFPRPARPGDEAEGTEGEENQDESSIEEITPEELNWPPAELCRVMEQIGSDQLFNGFSVGIRNSRGATCRNPLAGGASERALAARYQAMAAHHENDFPRIAAALRGVADSYEREAIWHDEDSERIRIER